MTNSIWWQDDPRDAMLRKLLSLKDIQVDVTDSNGQTALGNAFRRFNWDGCRILLSHGANFSLVKFRFQGEPPLIRLVSSKNWDLLKIALQQPNTDLSQKSDKGGYLLHHFFMEFTSDSTDCIDCAEIIVKKFDINLEANSGSLIFDLVVRFHRHDAIKYLLSKSIDAMALSPKTKEEVLSWQQDGLHAETIEILEEYDALEKGPQLTTG